MIEFQEISLINKNKHYNLFGYYLIPIISYVSILRYSKLMGLIIPIEVHLPYFYKCLKFKGMGLKYAKYALLHLNF